MNNQPLTFPRPFGKYLLVQRVASGGMAEIFLAVESNPTTGGRRFVTIKKIRPEFSHSEDYIEFFVTEGRVSLQCSHPHLPVAFELGQEYGQHYLAMEYIHGDTLLNALRASIRKRRRPSFNVAMCIGLAATAALEHVHSLRDVDGQPLTVIHRDVTPQNIMVSTAGVVKLIDFGIVRSAVQRHTTEAGTVKGKFAYMAPEQLDENASVDCRADLFSLGIVLWETLCARPLFRGKNQFETMDRVKAMPIPDVRQIRDDIPHQFANVVHTALHRDLTKRYRSATEFLHALEDVATSCQLAASITRLRDEFAELCGNPQWPAVTHSAPEEIALAQTCMATPATDGSKQSTTSGVTEDAMLQYYLRVAGNLPNPT